MTIYDSYNNVLLETTVSDKSSLYCGLDNKDRLTLHFTLDRHVDIPIGSWCNFEGNRYEVMSDADVKMNHTENYDYTVVLSSYFALVSRYKVCNMVDKRLKFDLVAKPHEHLQMIVDNLNSRDGGWSVGSCIDSVEKLVSYNHTNCEEALVNIADAFSTEIEVVGKAISLKKVEYFKNDPLALSYGKGNGFRPGIQRTSIDDGLPVQRLFVQGGSRNISLKEYGSSELHLPKNLSFKFDGNKFNGEYGFVDSHSKSFTTDAKGMSVYVDGMTNGREDSLDLSEVYPSRVGMVTGVVFIFKGTEYNSPESSWTADDWNEVQIDIIDNTIPYSLDFNECLMENNEPLTVVFQSGMLAGRELSASYLSDKKRFQLIKQEFDGQTMPQDSFIPKIGDSYAVFNVYLPASYISDATTYSGAEYDILREASRYLYEKCVSEFNFAGEIDGMWAKKNWDAIRPRIRIGSYVSFTHDKMFPEEPALVRIVGITQYVNNPHYPKIELSNSVGFSTVSSRINKIENNDAHVEELYDEARRYTKRRYTDIKQTISMLEKALLSGFNESIAPITINTMSMLVGDESLQFRFVDNMEDPSQVSSSVKYDKENKRIISEGDIIQHMTLGITDVSPEHKISDYKFWNVGIAEDCILEDKEKAYYLYIKASKDNSTAEYVVSQSAIGMEEVDGYYYFLTAILNSATEEGRNIAFLNGFTEVLPSQITTGAIRSADGNTWLDLLKGILHLNNAAGISGVKTEEKGDKSIAAWFGGSMEDKELDEGSENPAKSVIRHDGTGYFAGGNIRWGEQGEAEFGGGDFKIMPDGSIVFGKNIKISAESDETLGTILAALATFNDMFYKTNDGQSIGTKYNFFSEGEVSAKGLSSGGASSGGLIQNVLGLSSLGSVSSNDNATTFNAYAIDSIYKKVVELEQNGGGTGGGGGAGADLSNYYTIQQTKDAIGEALIPYAKTADLDGKYAPLAGFNTLKSDFDALSKALNDDVSGKINTWNEIVDFLDEYSGSENLAVILEGMNADINSRVLQSTYSAFLTDEFNPLKTKVGNHDSSIVELESWVESAGPQIATNKENIEKILGWFKLDSNGNLYTEKNFYSTKEISANGLSVGGGGGGLISSVLGKSALGTVTLEDNSITFNAFAIDSLYNRIVALEQNGGGTGGGEGSLVSWAGTISSGKKIGTLTINGVSNNLYAPSSYEWSDIANKPTSLSEFEDDLVEGHYMPLAGGTITGNLRLKGSSNYGNYLYFGDGSYCYLQEDTDDHLKVYASKGVSVITGSGYGLTVNGAALLTEDSLDGYATEKFVTDKGYVTEAWVTNKGYITSSALSGFATQTWVTNKGYITSSALTGYATQTWVTTQGYATQTWVNNKGYLTSSSLNGYATQTWVNTQLDSYLPLAGGTITGNLTVNGYAKIGSATLTWKSSALEVNKPFYSTGEISANGLYTSSDIRFKNKAEDVILDIDTIANAPMFKFTWNNKEDERVHIGSSAQYWKEYASELVSVDKDDFHRLDYATLGVLMGVTLGKKAKNHEERIKELELKVESLEAENRRLRYEC